MSFKKRAVAGGASALAGFVAACGSSAGHAAASRRSTPVTQANTIAPDVDQATRNYFAANFPEFSVDERSSPANVLTLMVTEPPGLTSPFTIAVSLCQQIHNDYGTPALAPDWTELVVKNDKGGTFIDDDSFIAEHEFGHAPAPYQVCAPTTGLSGG